MAEWDRQQAVKQWFADSRNHPADFDTFAAALPATERAKLNQAFEDNKPGQLSQPGGLSYWGRQASKTLTAVDDWGDRNLGGQYTPGSWEDRWNRSARNFVEGMPAHGAKALDDLLTEDEARNGNPHFQPLAGESAEQADQRLHPFKQDVKDARDTYTSELGPLLHGDTTVLRQRFHDDPVGTAMRYVPFGGPLLKLGGKATGAIRTMRGAGTAGAEEATAIAGAARATTPVHGAPAAAAATGTTGGTARVAAPHAGDRAASGPDTSPTQPATGSASPGGKTPTAGHAEVRSALGTTSPQANDRNPATPLTEHLNSVVPPRRGVFADQLGLSSAERQTLPQTLRDNPDYTYFEHRSRGFVRRTNPLDRTEAQYRPKSVPGNSEKVPGNATGRDDAAHTPPRPTPAQAPERTTMSDWAKAKWSDGREKLSNLANRGRRGDSDLPWPALPARTEHTPGAAAGGSEPAEVVRDAAQRADAASRGLHGLNVGSRHPELDDAGQLLGDASDRLRQVHAQLGDAASLTAGTAHEVLGTGPRSAERSAREPAKTPSADQWPVGAPATKFSWWSTKWPNPPPDWQGAWPPAADNLRSGTASENVTSFEVLGDAVTNLRRSMPTPRELHDAADTVDVASEQARFHPEFSIDRNYRAAEQLSEASTQLRNIADTVQQAHNRINDALDAIPDLRDAAGARPTGAAAGGVPETFYRGMSHAEARGLTESGELSVRGESFVTQHLPYIRQLADRWPDKYETVIQFEMESGTQQALLDAGRRDSSAIVKEAGLGDLRPIAKGLKDVVYVISVGGGPVKPP